MKKFIRKWMGRLWSWTYCPVCGGRWVRVRATMFGEYLKCSDCGAEKYETFS